MQYSAKICADLGSEGQVPGDLLEDCHCMDPGLVSGDVCQLYEVLTSLWKELLLR